MKRKTLLVLLSIALILVITIFVLSIANSVEDFRTYRLLFDAESEHLISSNYYYNGQRVTKSEWIRLMKRDYLIEPLVLLLSSFFLVPILLYLIIGVVKRSPLILNKDEQYTIEQRQSDNLQEEPVEAQL